MSYEPSTANQNISNGDAGDSDDFQDAIEDQTIGTSKYNFQITYPIRIAPINFLCISNRRVTLIKFNSLRLYQHRRYL